VGRDVAQLDLAEFVLPGRGGYAQQVMLACDCAQSIKLAAELRQQSGVVLRIFGPVVARIPTRPGIFPINVNAVEDARIAQPRREVALDERVDAGVDKGRAVGGESRVGEVVRPGPAAYGD